MDALYFFKHSRFADAELRFSLRSIEQNLPWIRKVWILGDRPDFLAESTSIAEHVPHEYLAPVGNFRTPVTNFFLLFYLAAIIPHLDHEFLWFCDDFIVLEPLAIEQAKLARVVENLEGVPRGTGLWKESLWRTFDLLKRFGYTGWNFETHVPTYFTKTRILEAYCDFRDFVTEDRWYGMLGPTAILNHALTRELIPLVKLSDEGRKVGFYGAASAKHEIAERCRGKTFLNFDDDAYDAGMASFLEERFPSPCKYESDAASSLSRFEEQCFTGLGGQAPPWPEYAGKRVAVFLDASPLLPLLLNQLLRLPAVTVLVCPNAEPDLKSYFAGSRIRVASDPVDLARLANECELAIGKGTPRFTMAMREAGKAQLLLPMAKQDRELALKLANDGRGLIADASSAKDTLTKLREVWQLVGTR